LTSIEYAFSLHHLLSIVYVAIRKNLIFDKNTTWIFRYIHLSTYNYFKISFSKNVWWLIVYHNEKQKIIYWYIFFFTYIKHTLVKVCIEIKTKRNKQEKKSSSLRVYIVYIYIYKLLSSNWKKKRRQIRCTTRTKEK